MKKSGWLCIVFIMLITMCYSCNGNRRDCKTDFIYTQYNVLVQKQSVSRVLFESFLDTYQLQHITLESLSSEIIDDGSSLALTDKQKRWLLSDIFDYPIDSYEAAYFDVTHLNDSIVSVAYLVNFYKIPEVYIVNYSLNSHNIKEVLDGTDLDYLNWIRYDEEQGFFYKLIVHKPRDTLQHITKNIWKYR